MLAPMAELSHRALRELIEELHNNNKKINRGEASPLASNLRFSADPPLLGAGAPKTPQSPPSGDPPVYYSEMISAAGLFSGGPFEKWYLDSGPCPERFVYQILGSGVEKIAAAAALLDRQECLGIDINMGCSAPAITRTGGGVRWMEDMDRAGLLAAAVRKTTKKRLSVKLRTGPKNPPSCPDIPPAERGTEPPGFAYLAAFCRRLEAEGVDLIILHPRTAREKFTRRARWEYVRALRKELSIPVAGNGDIACTEELFAKAREGPVMTGRLAVREPWLWGADAGQAVSSLFLEETALRFIELLARHQPPEFHLSRARRFFRYYCDNLTWAEHARNRINRETSLEGIAKAVRESFRNG